LASAESSLSQFQQTGSDVSYDRITTPWNLLSTPRSLKHLIYLSPDFLFDKNFVKILSSTWLKISVWSRVLDATLALTQYRLERGEYPASFSDLVPVYLTSTPTGYQRDEPLQFKETQGGIIVYSAGPDGVDNAGKHDGTTGTIPNKTDGHDTVYFKPVVGIYSID
jgi:hypothetical protein